MDKKDNDYIQVQYLSPRLQPAPTMNQGITHTYQYQRVHGTTLFCQVIVCKVVPQVPRGGLNS